MTDRKAARGSTEDPPDRGVSCRILTATVALGSALWFGLGVRAEPHFADESAYLSQSYYSAIYFGGRWNDRAWLDYPAFDLPPLPKYLIGAAYSAVGHRLPGPADARAWYEDTSRRFDPPGALLAARVPSVLLGAVGCAAVCGIGVLAYGRTAGVLAATLLAVNPLYAMLSRRAMSDVPCEALGLVGLYFALRVGTTLACGESNARVLPNSLAAGFFFGLSLLSKMSGLLGLIVAGAWWASVAAWRSSAKSAVGSALAFFVAGSAALATLVALNPFLTTHPPGLLPAASKRIADNGLVGRLRLMAALRVKVATDQQTLFPHNAVHAPAEKVSVVAAQGFGRFGPFGPAHSDSTRRFDVAQDRGAFVWIPWVSAGAVLTYFQGRDQARRGLPPTAWAVLTQFAVVLAVVTAYLPMAWDRYFLAIQAPAALLAAEAAVAAGRALRRLGRPDALEG